MAISAGNEPATGPPAAPVEVVMVPAPSSKSARWHRTLFSAMALAAIIVLGLTSLYLAMSADRNDPAAAPTASPSVADNSEFIADVTYPDGSKVRPGSVFRKVWRIRNIGTTFWADRRLTRVNPGPCRSPEMVSIPPTAPGQTVDIAVEVQAIDEVGHCLIYWKMTDAEGRALLPDKRPVFLDVQVGAP
ncbi:NBR1-Ig-like domain-containing protein [Nonomuraea antimicrobica]|uniref:NBR1-Ig-like domain-containing protein n=1 Tax=Nonomuraea antimicrobica TaxID=561173 RepID=UPI0031E7EEA5